MNKLQKLWIEFICYACKGYGNSGTTESCPVCMGKGYLTEIIEIVDYKFIE